MHTGHHALRSELHRGPAPRLLVSEREAASMLSICPRSLWTLRTAGEIPHVRVGRSVRYAVADLEQWIEQQRNGPATSS